MYVDFSYCVFIWFLKNVNNVFWSYVPSSPKSSQVLLHLLTHPTSCSFSPFKNIFEGTQKYVVKFVSSTYSWARALHWSAAEVQVSPLKQAFPPLWQPPIANSFSTRGGTLGSPLLCAGILSRLILCRSHVCSQSLWVICVSVIFCLGNAASLKWRATSGS